MKRLLFAALLGLGACMSQENMGAIEAAASRFYDLQSTRQDAEIVADATQGFRDAATVADIVRLNDAVRAAQNCTTPVRDQANWRSSQTTNGHFVVVTYRRQCDGGEMVDTFTFQMVGDRAILHGYHVAGMALFPTTQPTPPPPATPEAAATTETPAPTAPASETPATTTN